MDKGIIELTGQNFDKEVLKSTVPVLVDFWATWCGPCKALAGVLEDIAKIADKKFKIAKLNIDDYSQLASEREVMNIPTMILFKDGKEVDRLVGLMPKVKILAKINQIL